MSPYCDQSPPRQMGCVCVWRGKQTRDPAETIPTEDLDRRQSIREGALRSWVVLEKERPRFVVSRERRRRGEGFGAARGLLLQRTESSPLQFVGVGPWSRRVDEEERIEGSPQLSRLRVGGWLQTSAGNLWSCRSTKHSRWRRDRDNEDGRSKAGCRRSGECAVPMCRQRRGQA